MKRIRVFIINYLGFTKTEANATIVLVGIVLMFAIAPRIYFRFSHVNSSSVENDSRLLREWLTEIESNLEVRKKEESNKPSFKRFAFDPNTASEKTLKELGFKPYIASRIISYRNAGGNFQHKEDLKKIFGIDTSLVADLHSFIEIAPKKVVDKPIKEAAPITPKIAPKLSMDLNLASEEELQQIRGIGPFYARNIVSYRTKLGGYYSFQQLKEVYRMKPQVVELLKEYTYLEAPELRKLPINTDSLKLIAQHPYLTWNQAKVIMNYRNQHGVFTAADQLLKIKIITDSLYQKISPYISVEP